MFSRFLILFIYIISIGQQLVLFITWEQLVKSYSATSTFKCWGSALQLYLLGYASVVMPSKACFRASDSLKFEIFRESVPAPAERAYSTPRPPNCIDGRYARNIILNVLISLFSNARGTFAFECLIIRRSYKSNEMKIGKVLQYRNSAVFAQVAKTFC